MNSGDAKYQSFALVREMLETVEVVRGFDVEQTRELAGQVRSAGRLLLAGEGSSRLFPAKNAIRKALRWGVQTAVVTDGCYQAAQYDLSRFATILASNSGRTREAIHLARQLERQRNALRFGLTATPQSLLAQSTAKTWVLKCGKEEACAATKSVVEQAMFHQSLVSHLAGRDMRAEMAGLAEKVGAALGARLPAGIAEKAARAGTIYLAGYNDGVAEELALKTNEITRKKSDYLEGTYAAHGVEEIMDAGDVVIVVDPIEEAVEKFQEVLVKGVGLTVVAIADRETPFPTIRVPQAGEMAPYLYLCAGWNLLVEIGLLLGVNLDKPQRARKVGNEFVVA